MSQPHPGPYPGPPGAPPWPPPKKKNGCLVAAIVLVVLGVVGVALAAIVVIGVVVIANEDDEASAPSPPSYTPPPERNVRATSEVLLGKCRWIGQSGFQVRATVHNYSFDKVYRYRLKFEFWGGDTEHAREWWVYRKQAVTVKPGQERTFVVRKIYPRLLEAGWVHCDVFTAVKDEVRR